MTDIEWADARHYYEDDGWTASMIADYMGISKQTVYGRARREAWVRPEVPRRRRRAVIQELAEAHVAEEVAAQLGAVREDAILEANAQEVSRVMLLHRAGASGIRELIARLFNELRLTCIPEDRMMQLVELVAMTEETPRAEQATLDAFRQLLDLDNRADITKKLVDSMTKVIDLERRVYGIKDEVVESDVTKALKELADKYE